jgi:hypothetical protein
VEEVQQVQEHLVLEVEVGQVDIELVLVLLEGVDLQSLKKQYNLKLILQLLLEQVDQEVIMAVIVFFLPLLLLQEVEEVRIVRQELLVVLVVVGDQEIPLLLKQVVQELQIKEIQGAQVMVLIHLVHLEVEVEVGLEVLEAL